MRLIVLCLIVVVGLVCEVYGQTQWPLLSYGARGDNVESLQHLLNFHGSSLAADGIFGNGTENALVAFQKKKGIAATAKTDQATWESLCPLCSSGDNHAGVKALQVQLNKHSENVAEDGIFGAATEDAVESIQKRIGLTITGDYDMNTWRESLGKTAGSLPVAVATVEDMISTSCSTTSVKGLSVQLVNTVNKCLHSGLLKDISGVPNVSFGSAVFPYMQAPALSAFDRAMRASTRKMTMNSAYRSLAQQLLLYRWYLAGRCGISLAAKPGTSNHEGALAFDCNDGQSWASFLSGYSFKWLGSSDPVHFDYVGSGTINILPSSTKAFQMLWNKNNPNDKIAEDGIYGTETEKRLLKSPANGFPITTGC